VGTDGSDTAGEALRRAGDLAKQVGARVHVVSAYHPLSGAHLSGASSAPEQSEWAIKPDVAVERLLETAAGALRVKGVETETHARKGDAAEAILDVADELNADLIVVGNRGMQGAKRFLLGNVPNKVSHHASCSVMIVRTT
jgi:nucleotide-binding universal stress UspA family protein